MLNSVWGSIKKLFTSGFVKPADTLKARLSLTLPVIDFTPLSLTIVLSALRGGIQDKVSSRATSI